MVLFGVPLIVIIPPETVALTPGGRPEDVIVVAPVRL
jgi:hypothetical protein